MTGASAPSGGGFCGLILVAAAIQPLVYLALALTPTASGEAMALRLAAGLLGIPVLLVVTRELLRGLRGRRTGRVLRGLFLAVAIVHVAAATLGWAVVVIGGAVDPSLVGALAAGVFAVFGGSACVCQGPGNQILRGQPNGPPRSTPSTQTGSASSSSTTSGHPSGSSGLAGAGIGIPAPSSGDRDRRRRLRVSQADHRTLAGAGIGILAPSSGDRDRRRHLRVGLEDRGAHRDPHALAGFADAPACGRRFAGGLR